MCESLRALLDRVGPYIPLHKGVLSSNDVEKRDAVTSSGAHRTRPYVIRDKRSTARPKRPPSSGRDAGGLARVASKCGAECFIAWEGHM